MKYIIYAIVVIVALFMIKYLYHLFYRDGDVLDNNASATERYMHRMENKMTWKEKKICQIKEAWRMVMQVIENIK